MTESADTGLLLDSHVLLWWLSDADDLSAELKERIDTELVVCFSAASVWELSIKEAAGKLEVPGDFAEALEHSGLIELPVRRVHGPVAGRLPAIHRDPFDRMLVAQALVEDLALVTRDRFVQRYDVQTVKA
ncbi:type II toxin-antitoxin system VapC family toxin [Kribbella sp. NPDC026611]|uniref:type II toxin-antitoxin system VapC family toxin n=1 Tax=Kribbella sp. NPDC026611 TaxID=3154911 RepID=UPI0033C6804A